LIGHPMLVAACLKWVDLRPDVDPLTGTVAEDPRFFGLSASDQAALEWALRLGEAWSAPVLALTAGPPPVEAGLREALACGAARAIRVPITDDASSAAVASVLAVQLQSRGPAVVCCGDRSADRGSGSVPAYLAARLGAVQALGLVTLAVDGVGEDQAALVVERRLDRGRRERLRLRVPAVVSIEGNSARLRRAGLPGVLAARRTAIEVADEIAPADRSGRAVWVEHRGPFRPRPRVLAAPDPTASPRDRILGLVGAMADREPPRTVHADPDEAARTILEQLRSWGYVE
jgi:electron transfer flavoprotein beta subunit